MLLLNFIVFCTFYILAILYFCITAIKELLPLPWDKARMEIKPLEEDRAALVRLKERLGKRLTPTSPSR